ncbi:MAG: bifunctional (p)ppGpp synthetase/guanosine-3',5'-bis(diphosphate) 3'-pyrophosphohydrolase [Alphaproteobacteria bacterium]|nr:bifunctional (p)ppGpp synthetase/guanosine-3',5'-bis(diphosphate) 3'-pyrophosphohydrolase [Alphaproteobacteria bacterium]
MRQFELVEKVKSYDPKADEDAINRAYVFALKAHGSQTRASGDPYFSHPVEVAGLLTRYRLDTNTIVTALLHDVVEDTPVTLDEIEKVFGPQVARLVDGVTKLSRLEHLSDRAKQAENFRKLVLAMSEDIRVLLVKLADRLHNMRTLKHVRDPEKRRRIAAETLDIYAPLAERIGMEEVKQELETIAFAEMHPDAYQSIVARLGFLRSQGETLIEQIIGDLKRMMSEGGIKAEVSGREKTPYSIWRKMRAKDASFEQFSDIMAFRVIVESVEECYRALGIVHGAFHVVPGRFKDYISTPKPNGYRSLHTGVIVPPNQRIEIQIRTREMHNVAEYGVAAHWSYKQGEDAGREGRQYRWLRSLLEILEQAADPQEFLEHTRLEMFQDQVFCFTPKGDLITLPRGATPVDFAYAVHSQVGDSCVGAKINGRIMPLRTQLRNGDQVEIITAKGHTPSPTWERFVVTGRARARIRRFINLKQREQFLDLGRSMVAKALRQEGVDPSDKVVEPAVKPLKQASLEDLYVVVGKGDIGARDVVLAAFPELKAPSRAHAVAPLTRLRRRAAAATDGAGSGEAGARAEPAARNALPIRGLIPGMAIHFAGCCHPLPGDRIIGIVTTGKGVTIHTADCQTLESFAATPERFVDVDWEYDGPGRQSHVGRIHVVTANEQGALANLTNVIAKHDGNINNLKIINRQADFFEMAIDLEVSDLGHLSNIIAALRASPSVTTVERARS